MQFQADSGVWVWWKYSRLMWLLCYQLESSLKKLIFFSFLFGYCGDWVLEFHSDDLLQIWGLRFIWSWMWLFKSFGFWIWCDHVLGIQWLIHHRVCENLKGFMIFHGSHDDVVSFYMPFDLCMFQICFLWLIWGRNFGNEFHWLNSLVFTLHVCHLFETLWVRLVALK